MAMGSPFIVAQAGLNGKVYHLGRFHTVEEAVAVVTAWRREHMPYSTEAPSSAPVARGQQEFDFAA